MASMAPYKSLAALQQNDVVSIVVGVISWVGPTPTSGTGASCTPQRACRHVAPTHARAGVCRELRLSPTRLAAQGASDGRSGRRDCAAHDVSPDERDPANPGGRGHHLLLARDGTGRSERLLRRRARLASLTVVNPVAVRTAVVAHAGQAIRGQPASGQPQVSNDCRVQRCPWRALHSILALGAASPRIPRHVRRTCWPANQACATPGRCRVRSPPPLPATGPSRLSTL